MKILMEDGSYKIGNQTFAYKVRSFWVIVWQEGSTWHTSDPAGGQSYFGREYEAVSWAENYGYHYKTLTQAAETQ